MYNEQTKTYVPTMLNSIYLNQPNSPYSESSCESHYADSPYFDGLSEMQSNLSSYSSKDQATDFFSKEKLNDSFYDEVLDFNDCEGEVMNSQDTVRIVNFRDSQSAQDLMHVPAATFNGDPNLLLLNKKASRSPSPVHNLHYLGEQYDELVYPELGGLLFPESETPSAYYSSEDEYCAIFDSGSPLSITDEFDNGAEQFDKCDEADISIQKLEELVVQEHEVVQEREEKEAVNNDETGIKEEQDELEEEEIKKVKQEDDDEEEEQQQQSSAKSRTRKRKAESSATTTTTTTTTKNNNNKRRKTAAKASYQCPICSHVSVRKYNMTTHIKTHDKNRIKEFTCFQCQKGFDRRHDRDRHLATVHRLERSHACGHCTAHFSRADALERHLAHKHGYDVED